MGFKLRIIMAEYVYFFCKKCFLVHPHNQINLGDNYTNKQHLGGILFTVGFSRFDYVATCQPKMQFSPIKQELSL